MPFSAKVTEVNSSKETVTLNESQTVRLAAQLITTKQVGCIIVTSSDNSYKPVGIITEHDIVSKVVSKRKSTRSKLSEIMTKPVITRPESVTIKQVTQHMALNDFKRIPIVDEEGNLVKVCTLSDILSHLLDSPEISEEHVIRYLKTAIRIVKSNS